MVKRDAIKSETSSILGRRAPMLTTQLSLLCAFPWKKYNTFDQYIFFGEPFARSSSDVFNKMRRKRKATAPKVRAWTVVVELTAAASNRRTGPFHYPKGSRRLQLTHRPSISQRLAGRRRAVAKQARASFHHHDIAHNIQIFTLSGFSLVWAWWVQIIFHCKS